MNTLALQWHKALAKRKEEGNLRRLAPVCTGVDFCSNDYLGFSESIGFQENIMGSIGLSTRMLTGATGSRLISGNSQVAGEVEEFIAGIHGVEGALLFPSGYKANLALFSCVAGRNDTIILDELVHRSVHDGCQMSRAERWKFRHNDLSHLERLLKKAKGNIIIAVESLYSMDGDYAPLNGLIYLARKYGAGLVVDEAHAIGVFGKGLVHLNRLQRDVLATVVTFGKALGVQGAAVLGGNLLKEYLVNFSTPFIYSTAMPGVQLLSIKAAYGYLENHPELPATLQERIHHFRHYELSGISEERSPVQVVRFASTAELMKVTEELQEAAFRVYAMFAPTVKAGAERLRICLHAFNSNREIDGLCTIIKKYEYR